MTYALDTGIIICHLNCDEILEKKMDEVVFAGNRFIIPPVVDYEIQRGLLYKPSPKKERIYCRFLPRKRIYAYNSKHQGLHEYCRITH